MLIEKLCGNEYGHWNEKCNCYFGDDAIKCEGVCGTWIDPKSMRDEHGEQCPNCLGNMWSCLNCNAEMYPDAGVNCEKGSKDYCNKCKKQAVWSKNDNRNLCERKQ